jgi:hypothetical protein
MAGVDNDSENDENDSQAPSNLNSKPQQQDQGDGRDLDLLSKVQACHNCRGAKISVRKQDAFKKQWKQKFPLGEDYENNTVVANTRITTGEYSTEWKEMAVPLIFSTRISSQEVWEDVL